MSDISVMSNHHHKHNFGYLFKSQALELSWGHGSTVFLSWTFGRISSSHDSNEVELCQQLGEKLGLKAGEQVHISHCAMFASCILILVLSYGTFRKSPI